MNMDEVLQGCGYSSGSGCWILYLGMHVHWKRSQVTFMTLNAYLEDYFRKKSVYLPRCSVKCLIFIDDQVSPSFFKIYDVQYLTVSLLSSQPLRPECYLLWCGSFSHFLKWMTADQCAFQMNNYQMLLFKLFYRHSVSLICQCSLSEMGQTWPEVQLLPNSSNCLVGRVCPSSATYCITNLHVHVLSPSILQCPPYLQFDLLQIEPPLPSKICYEYGFFHY